MEIIPLGIGTPGTIRGFLLLGLQSRAITGLVALTLRARSFALTLLSRNFALTLRDR